MTDKIVTVRTVGPNFRTIETPAVKMFGAVWINMSSHGEPISLGFYNNVSGHFERAHDGWRDPWHRVRVAAALRRHPECR